MQNIKNTWPPSSLASTCPAAPGFVSGRALLSIGEVLRAGFRMQPCVRCEFELVHLRYFSYWTLEGKISWMERARMFAHWPLGCANRVVQDGMFLVGQRAEQGSMSQSSRAVPSIHPPCELSTCALTLVDCFGNETGEAEVFALGRERRRAGRFVSSIYLPRLGVLVDT